MKKIIQWWVTPKLPKQHYIGNCKNFVCLVKTWLIHPVKRRLAKIYLCILQKFFDIQVIGVTGSAGKTTTKEMLASVLKRECKTVWTKDNIDPIYNIPTTILRCSPRTKYLILEMGVEYPGEMDFYLWLSRPDIAIVTNVFPTHTLFFENEKGVAREKGKLVDGLTKGGIAVLNSNNFFTKAMAKNTKAKVLWFGKSRNIEKLNKEAVEVLVKHLGIKDKHIKSGLDNYSKPKNRLNLFKHKSGAKIFDDTYNSNPEAFLLSLNNFLKLAGKNKKIAVVGDMLELGKLEKNQHKKIGEEISKHGFEMVIGVGSAIKFSLKEIEKQSGNTKTFLASSNERVFDLLKPHINKNTFIFLKGSRSIGLDKVVDRLL